MKLAKKLASLTLALVMILALSVPALAAGPEGETPDTTIPATSITVTNAQGGETYNIYKLLDLNVSADLTAYTYTVNEKWTNFFTDAGAGAEYVNIDDQGYVTWKKDKDTADDMIAFGKAAAQYAVDNSVPVAAVAQTPTEDGNVAFTELEPGYYMVTSTNGTKVIIDTTPTNPNPEIKEKNENPNIDKTVEEDSTGAYGDTNDAEIGQVVNFKSVVTAKPGAKNYVVHDKMSEGLTFDATSVEVKAGETTLSLNSDYVVKANAEEEPLDDDCTFHIEFTQTYLDTIIADTEIVITYSATLNNKAIVAGDGNPNETRLDWGEANHTEWDKTVTYTWEMDVLKYGNNDEENLLENAQFVLLNSDETKVAKFDATGKITEWINVPQPTEGAEEVTWEDESILTTDKDGKINIHGLDSADKYLLREIKAPEGYNLVKEPTEVTITRGESATPNTLAQVALTTKVNNNSGTELPSTGGIGTTIFYAVGGVLVLAAVILLVAKKRMAR